MDGKAALTAVNSGAVIAITLPPYHLFFNSHHQARGLNEILYMLRRSVTPVTIVNENKKGQWLKERN
jgi:hypothetical protein